MKKAIAILLSLTMILGLAACGNSASQTEQPSTEDTSVESKADTNSAENSTDMENTDNQDVQDHKVLVAYFSATGTTKGVAEQLHCIVRYFLRQRELSIRIVSRK